MVFIAVPFRWCKASLHRREERLALFDYISGKLRPVAGADILRRMGCPGRDKQDVAGLDPHHLAADLVLQGAFDDVDDLLPRVRVHGGDITGVEVDAHLDDLASGSAEI